MAIEIRNLTKSFDGFTALDNVSLTVEPGELLALLGPSGSGKTTLLRLVAGLEALSGGRVLFDGEDVARKPVGERSVGFVFQHYALFKHMTVFENVAFGMRVRQRKARRGPAALRDRVHELLELVQLEGLAQRYPNQLSGGQRQRVALARALAIDPKVLLLDEPFGALDARVREELRRWLRTLHEEMHLTTVFVTHDQEEAFELADRVVVMRDGRIEQIDTPDLIYDRPATPFVYEFLGEVNRLPCTVTRGRARFLDHDIPIETVMPGRSSGAQDGGKVEALRRGYAYVRPEDIELYGRREADAVPAIVRHLAVLGSIARVELEVSGMPVRVEVQLGRSRVRELDLQPGREVFMRLRHVRVFDEAADAA